MQACSSQYSTPQRGRSNATARFVPTRLDSAVASRRVGLGGTSWTIAPNMFTVGHQSFGRLQSCIVKNPTHTADATRQNSCVESGGAV